VTHGLKYLKSLFAGQRREQRRRLVIAAATAGAATAAGVLLLGLSGGFITGAALAGLAGVAAAQTFNVLLPSAAIRLLAIVRTGCRYVERVSSHEAALKALAALRPILFKELASARPETALAMSSGEVSSRLVQDVDAIQTLFIRLGGPWGAAAGAVVSIGLASLAGPVAGAVVTAGLVSSITGSIIIGRLRVDVAGCQVQIATGLFKSRLATLQASAPELRAYGLESWAVAQAQGAGADLDDATTRVSLGAGWITAWQSLVAGVAVAGVLAVSVRHPAPMVALAALAAVASSEAAAALTTRFRSTGAAIQALSRLSDLLTQQPRNTRASARPEADPVLGFGAFGLTVGPSRRLAVTGATGSGKTTLIERLMGLRQFPDASLTVAGIASFEAEGQWLRSQFAYAAQEVRLLEGTVRANLLIADPHADDATLWRALEDADIADRLRAHEVGLDLRLSDNGLGLSGGERRRLGLARAYLRSALWLVLDEPTEGLDGPCEARVVERLKQRLVRTGQGLIVISHRPAPREICDTVIALTGLDEHGRPRFMKPEVLAAAA
jgi:ATP-binding cassette subfamily C protein CydC